MSTFSQVPQAFNYQAVVRDNSGNLLAEEVVNFQVDIVSRTIDGSVVYSETHSTTTSARGLVTLKIGTGTSTDDFSAIEWGEDLYFIKLWVNGSEMGTTQLLSVPYAQHAQSAKVFTGDEIKNLIDPTDEQDAATKAYVDRQITNPGIRIQAVVDSVKCFGASNGAIDLTISGGTSPYQVEWDDGSTTEDLTGLGAGKYQVYVEDSNGMTGFRHFTLQTPEEIIIDYVATPASGDIDITVTGGRPPYTYLWSNGSTSQDQSGLEFGTYTVQVTDALGCTASEEINTGGESLLLIEWMESSENPAGKYYVNTDMGEYTTAEQLHGLIAADKAYVIDIRKEADFNLGHIEGAVNLTEAEVAAYLDTEDLSAYSDIVIACTSGQIAAWLTCLLNLDGYDNVSSLKFGMCSWHTFFADAWNGAISNGKSTFFVETPYEKGPEGDLPTLTTGFETAEEIFEARWDAIMAEGFGAGAITVDALYADLDGYYILNYWSNTDYTSMKHVEGAIQYTPKEDITLDAALKTLPTDKPIVVYGYTGQGSANLVPYLRLIGYDALSLKYGANAMIHDEMTKSTWQTTSPMEYDYVGMK